MQISSANLLAAQTQTARPRQAAPAFEPMFEPMAFKSATAPVAAKPSEASPAASLLSGSEPGASTGYVRPGTNLDIKI
jgi:hypothetical protein